MDFRGQRLSELLGVFLLVLSAILGWSVGYVKQSLILSIYIVGGGVFLTALVSNMFEYSEALQERN